MKKLLALVVLAGSAVACGGAAPAPAAPSAAAVAPSPLKPAGEAKIGDRTACPVSGEEFTVTAQSPKADYNGKTYYFCCEGCDKSFAKDPAKFLSAKK